MKRMRLGGLGNLVLAAGLGMLAFGSMGGSAALATSIPANRTIYVDNLNPSATLAQFLADHGNKCDASNNGWHFILNGLAPDPVGVGDVPATMTIVFSSGPPSSAALSKVNSSNVHYLNTTDHQGDGVYPVSGYLTFPNGTVTEYNNFVLSHIPCEFNSTTTTTTSTTTTTVPVTTTTVPVTTTTVPATTTTAPATTTTVLGDLVAPPLVPLAPVAPAASPAPVLTSPAATALPNTGSSTGGTVFLGSLLIMLGSLFVLRSRRPQSS